jgi:hypothetical protein
MGDVMSRNAKKSSVLSMVSGGAGKQQRMAAAPVDGKAMTSTTAAAPQKPLLDRSATFNGTAPKK